MKTMNTILYIRENAMSTLGLREFARGPPRLVNDQGAVLVYFTIVCSHRLTYAANL